MTYTHINDDSNENLDNEKTPPFGSPSSAALPDSSPGGGTAPEEASPGGGTAGGILNSCHLQIIPGLFAGGVLQVVL